MITIPILITITTLSRLRCHRCWCHQVFLQVKLGCLRRCRCHLLCSYPYHIFPPKTTAPSTVLRHVCKWFPWLGPRQQILSSLHQKISPPCHGQSVLVLGKERQSSRPKVTIYQEVVNTRWYLGYAEIHSRLDSWHPEYNYQTSPALYGLFKCHPCFCHPQYESHCRQTMT